MPLEKTAGRGIMASHVHGVKKLHVPAYIGRWYQVMASATVKYTMELGGNCVVADYGAIPNSTDIITVLNTCSPFDHTISVGGFGTKNPAEAGEFDVILGRPGHPAKAPQMPFKATNYVVAYLGPIVEGLYDYALVTDPRTLARTLSSLTLSLIGCDRC